MNIDFSKYTLEELYTCSRTIDRETFPENAKKIDELIAIKQKEHDKAKALSKIDPFHALAPITAKQTKLVFSHTKFYLRTVIYLTVIIGITFMYYADTDSFHSNIEPMFAGLTAMILIPYTIWEVARFIYCTRLDYIGFSNEGFSYQKCNKAFFYNWKEISSVKIITISRRHNLVNVKTDYLYINFPVQNKRKSLSLDNNIRFVVKQYETDRLSLAQVIHHYVSEEVEIDTD